MASKGLSQPHYLTWWIPTRMYRPWTGLSPGNWEAWNLCCGPGREGESPIHTSDLQQSSCGSHACSG